MTAGTLDRARATFDDSARRLGAVMAGLKLRTARNRFAVTRRRHPFRVAAQYGVVIPSVVGFTVVLALGFSQSVKNAPSQSAGVGILAAMLTLAAIGCFIGAATTALQSLFLADDVPFLVTLPVPLRVLFGSKLVDSMAGTAPASILLLGGIGGFASARTGGVFFAPVAVAVGVCFVAIPTAIAVTVVSLVARYIPPKRARIFLFAFSLTVVAVSAAGWRLLTPSGLPFAPGRAGDAGQASPTLLMLTPAGWAADALDSAAAGRPAHAALMTACLAAMTSVFVACSFEVCKRTFILGLTRTRAVQTASPNRVFAKRSERAVSIFPPAAATLILKEWLTLFRDLRRLSGAIWPLAIVLVYTVALGHGPLDGHSEIRAFWTANASLALLPWGLSLGLSLYSFGSEGRNVSILRSLPLTERRIFFCKAVANLIPVAAVSVAVVTLTLVLRSAPLVPALELVALVLWMAPGYVLIDTAASAVAPVFNAEQIQRAVALPGRAFSLVAGSLFGVATGVAALRIVLFSGDLATASSARIGFDIAGEALLGWPLIAAAWSMAGAVVAVAVAFAFRQTAAIVRDGD